MTRTLYLLALLSACGDNLAAPPDGPRPDAPGPDALAPRWSGVHIGDVLDDEVLDVELVDGVLYVAGYRDGLLGDNVGPTGDAVGYVRAMSPVDGHTLWEHLFDTTGADTVDAIDVGATDIALVGRTSGTFPGEANAGQVDAFVAMLPRSGGVPAIRQLGDERPQHFTRIVRDVDGDLLVAGYDDLYRIGNSVADFENSTAARIRASDLAVDWYRRDALGASDQTFALAATDTAGEIVVGGNVATGPTQGGHVRRVDAAGVERWRTRISQIGLDAVTAIERGPDGMIYVAGSSFNLVGNRAYGEQDVVVAVVDPSTGAIVRAMQAGTSAPDYPRDLVVAADGTVYVAGETLGAYPGATNAGLYDLAVVRFAPDGAWTGAWQHGSDTDETPRSIALGADAVFLGGYTEGAVLEGVPSNGRTDGFVLRVPLADLVSP